MVFALYFFRVTVSCLHVLVAAWLLLGVEAGALSTTSVVPMEVSVLNSRNKENVVLVDNDNYVIRIDLRLDGDVTLWQSHHFLNVRLYNDTFISGPWDVNSTTTATNSASSTGAPSTSSSDSSRSSAVVHYWFSIYSAGDYLLQVEVVSPSLPAKRETGDHTPVAGSPLKVRLAHTFTVERELLPVCTDAPPSFMSAPLTWTGYWVKPQRAGPGAGALETHSNYVFVPHHCRLPTLPTSSISALATGQDRQQQTWIVFAGSSIERGLFLTLVDAAVADPASKAKMKVSVVHKCWGWVDITLGSWLRVSYIDFRVAVHFNPTAVTCHNDLLVDGGPRLFQDGVKLMRMLFAQPHMPDLLWLPAVHSSYFRAEHYVQLLQTALDRQWRGTLVYGSSSVLPVDKPHKYLHQAFWSAEEMAQRDHDAAQVAMYHALLAATEDKLRVLYFDAFPAVSSRLESVERGPQCYTCSNHFHSGNFLPTAAAALEAAIKARAALTPVDVSVDPNNQFDSEVAATALQVILQALRPTSPALSQWPSPASTTASSSEPARTSPAAAATPAPILRIEVCYDCPDDMLPLHVTLPNLTAQHCVTGFNALEGNEHVTHKHRVPCPEYCLRQPVVGEVTVHGGGQLLERRCKILQDQAPEQQQQQQRLRRGR